MAGIEEEGRQLWDDWASMGQNLVKIGKGIVGWYVRRPGPLLLAGILAAKHVADDAAFSQQYAIHHSIFYNVIAAPLSFVLFLIPIGFAWLILEKMGILTNQALPQKPQ